MFSLKASISRYQNVMKLAIQKSSQNVNMTNGLVTGGFQKKNISILGTLYEHDFIAYGGQN